ncbi:MAG: glycosyltransferase family 4 protein [Coriobacteriales bacterium]
MRILHITAQKPDSTGSGIYLHQLVSSLAERGEDQAVLCGIDSGDPIDLPPGVDVYPVAFNTPQLPFHLCGMSDEMPYPSTRYRDLTPGMLAAWKGAYRSALRQALGRFKPDVVVCNHLYLLTALVVEELQALPQRIPAVAICHNTCLRQLEQHGLERELIRAAIPRLDLVFALHEEQAQRICRAFDIDPGKVRPIGTGYDSKLFRSAPHPAPHPAAAERHEADEPAIELCFAGKITYKKGVHSLLNALNLLPCRPGAVHLRLCGGVSNSFQKAAIELLIQENRQNVELLGKLAPAALAEQMRASQVFVLPSFYEGLPLVLVEALACGCKAVVSDLPGLRPWVEENIPGAPVWYVALPRMQKVDEPVKRDLPAFEERLAQAIKDAALAPARAVSCAHLSWGALAARLLGSIREL